MVTAKFFTPSDLDILQVVGGLTEDRPFFCFFLNLKNDYLLLDSKKSGRFFEARRRLSIRKSLVTTKWRIGNPAKRQRKAGRATHFSSDRNRDVSVTALPSAS